MPRTWLGQAGVREGGPRHHEKVKKWVGQGAKSQAWRKINPGGNRRSIRIVKEGKLEKLRRPPVQGRGQEGKKYFLVGMPNEVDEKVQKMRR